MDFYLFHHLFSFYIILFIQKWRWCIRTFSDCPISYRTACAIFMRKTLCHQQRSQTFKMFEGVNSCMILSMHDSWLPVLCVSKENASSSLQLWNIIIKIRVEKSSRCIYIAGLEREGCKCHFRPYKTNAYLKSTAQGASFEHIFIQRVIVRLFFLFSQNIDIVDTTFSF